MLSLTIPDDLGEEMDAAQLLGLSSTGTFPVKMSGHAMEEAHIPDGATLIVDRTTKPGHGDIIVAVLNGEVTVKRLIKIHAGWVLHPENTTYSPYLIREGDEFEVYGVVKTVVIQLK